MGLDVKEKNFLRAAGGRLAVVIGVLFAIRHFVGLPTFPAIVGWVVILLSAKYLLTGAFNNFARAPANLNKYGQWAIITGATSGLGESFAFEIAKQGINILLISRSADKLHVTRENLLNSLSTKVQVETMAFDYDTTNQDTIDKFYNGLGEWIQGKNKKSEPVGILINNVGKSNEIPEFMHALSLEESMSILRVNVESTIRMSHKVIPYFLERNLGAVINVSSASGNHSTPLLAMYSSTKAFITQFSQSLTEEYRKKGIDVYVCTPYYFVSQMFQRKKPTYMAPNPDVIVRDTLKNVGINVRGYPYVVHAIMGFAFKYLTPPSRIMGIMMNNKKRAEEKLAKAKKHSDDMICISFVP